MGMSRLTQDGTAHLHAYTQAAYGAYLRDSSRFSRRCPFIYLEHHTPLGQPRVYRVTQLRTDGVHYRESTDTGPVNLIAESVSRDQILRREQGQGILFFPVNLTPSRIDWQPYPVDPYSCYNIMTSYLHTYSVHTYRRQGSGDSSAHHPPLHPSPDVIFVSTKWIRVFVQLHYYSSGTVCTS